jgi:hypothetical protein
MHFATWNTNHLRRTPEERAAAWGFSAELGLDVALVQEASPPAGLRSRK